jgi:hypothetical protein
VAGDANEDGRIPIRGTFFGCCASVEGTVVSKTVINNQKKDFEFIVFSPVTYR